MEHIWQRDESRRTVTPYKARHSTRDHYHPGTSAKHWLDVHLADRRIDEPLDSVCSALAEWDPDDDMGRWLAGSWKCGRFYVLNIPQVVIGR